MMFNIRANLIAGVCRIIPGIVLLVGSFDSFGQANITRQLDEGDYVPNIPITISKGDSVYNVNFTDLRGTSVIIDFWEAHCMDCIWSMPDMLKLQNQYKKEVRVLIVTKDDVATLNKLWKRLELKNNSVSHSILNAKRHLEFVLNDTTLSMLFSPNGYPTHAWINRDSKYLFSSYYNTTTPENVRLFAQGDTPRVARIVRRKINLSEPLSWIKGESGELDSSVYYCFFRKRLEYGRGGDSYLKKNMDINGKLVGLEGINNTIRDLYRIAYQSDLPGITEQDIYIESEDPSMFEPPGDVSEYYNWAGNNTFCFAIRKPFTTEKELFDKFKLELDSYLNLTSWVARVGVRYVIVDGLGSKSEMAIFDLGLLFQLRFLIELIDPVLVSKGIIIKEQRKLSTKIVLRTRK